MSGELPEEISSMRYIYCHPLFDERKCAHRFSYQLARAFNKMGLTLERFDYTGCGENQGEFSRISLNSLRNDLIRFLANDQVTLIGLRFGASLAWDFCLRRPNQVKKLILIAPVLKGNEYIRHLLRKQKIKDLMTQNPPPKINAHPYCNLEGYKTSLNFIRDLEKFDLLAQIKSAPGIRSVLFLHISPNARMTNDLSSLRKTLLNHNDDLRFLNLPAGNFWERIPTADYTTITRMITNNCHE